jgi:phage major head subunit gpT-like protein
MTAISTNFGDLLDPRFQKIFNDRVKELPDRVGDFYNKVDGASAPTKDTWRTSEVGTFGDLSDFNGSVVYDDVYQQYDGIITPKEYTSGFQIARKLYDDAQYGIMDSKPKGLATAYVRTRQKHAATVWNNAFSVDTTWNNYTENVALCSNSHTTASPGVSTATGFDNLSTAALSAVAVAAGRIQMRGFRNDRGGRGTFMPSMILVPVDLEETAWEIVNSAGKLDTANNNRNFSNGRYKVADWEYLTDANNWFMIDETGMKDALTWVDRVPKQMEQIEDFDTLIRKWRLYCRYGLGHNGWRWLVGFQVS